MGSFPVKEAGVISRVRTRVIGCCVAAYRALCPFDMGCGDGHRSLLVIATLVSWAICNWFAIVCSFLRRYVMFLCDLALSNCYSLMILCVFCD